MTDVQILIDRNLEFASSFDQGDLAILPRLSTLVLTCLDARVDPAHFLGGRRRRDAQHRWASH